MVVVVVASSCHRSDTGTDSLRKTDNCDGADGMAGVIVMSMATAVVIVASVMVILVLEV